KPGVPTNGSARAPCTNWDPNAVLSASELRRRSRRCCLTRGWASRRDLCVFDFVSRVRLAQSKCARLPACGGCQSRARKPRKKKESPRHEGPRLASRAALVFPQGSLADGGRDGRRLPIIANGNCGSLVPARDSRTTTAVSLRASYPQNPPSRR